MGKYEDVLRFLAKCEDSSEAQMNARNKYDPKRIQEVVHEYAGIPQDYVAYLAEVGAGAFRECQYVVYDGFIDPDEIFDAETAATFGKRVLCFGDNFSGDPAGFLPDEDWNVVELWHDSLESFEPNQTFGEFIREKMLIGPDGNDLRRKR